MKCIVCGYSKSQVIRKSIRFEIPRKVLRCNHCQFVYLEHSATSQSIYKEKYRQLYGPDLTKTLSIRQRFNTYLPFQNEIINEIKKLLHPHTKILDVGCSSGQFLAALKNLVGTRVGLEINQKEAVFVRNQLKIPVYNVPLEHAHIKEAPFDIITVLQVLEHVNDPVNFLMHIGKFLNQKGYLYLEVPNINDILLGTYKIPEYADFYFREPHLWYFSSSALAQILEKSGFAGKIRTAQRYSLLNHLHWLINKKPQENFSVGNSIPKLFLMPTYETKTIQEINNLFYKFDKKYKKLINRYMLGESLTFLGKKI